MIKMNQTIYNELFKGLVYYKLQIYTYVVFYLPNITISSIILCLSCIALSSECHQYRFKRNPSSGSIRWLHPVALSGGLFAIVSVAVIIIVVSFVQWSVRTISYCNIMSINHSHLVNSLSI